MGGRQVGQVLMDDRVRRRGQPDRQGSRRPVPGQSATTQDTPARHPARHPAPGQAHARASIHSPVDRRPSFRTPSASRASRVRPGAPRRLQRGESTNGERRPGCCFRNSAAEKPGRAVQPSGGQRGVFVCPGSQAKTVSEPRSGSRRTSSAAPSGAPPGRALGREEQPPEQHRAGQHGGDQGRDARGLLEVDGDVAGPANAQNGLALDLVRPDNPRIRRWSWHRPWWWDHRPRSR